MRRVPTNTVPFLPSAMDRALARPSAQIAILNPGGSFTLSRGMSFAALAVSAGT
jgi:hypothetical protein